MRDLPSSHQIMGEEVISCCHFHLCYTCYTCYVSLQSLTREKNQQGLLSRLVLSLLVCKRVSSPSPSSRWCFTNVILVLYKFPTLKFYYGNQTKSPPIIKHMNWGVNHQMIIYGSHHFTGYGENAIKPFSH